MFLTEFHRKLARQVIFEHFNAVLLVVTSVHINDQQRAAPYALTDKLA